MEWDGTLSTGYSYDQPYATFWATTTVLPFLQLTGRYVAINGTATFANMTDPHWTGYGRYKDKVADAKLNLFKETESLPAVSIGATDLLGTGLFKGQYVVATKIFGAARNFEASIGYGKSVRVGCLPEHAGDLRVHRAGQSSQSMTPTIIARIIRLKRPELHSERAALFWVLSIVGAG